jgi:hypothetical protein
VTPPIHIAFVKEVIVVPLANILPTRTSDRGLAKSRKYRTIVASIEEVGIVEPLVVAKGEQDDRFLLIDGHLRYFALLDRGDNDVRCIIADDDETFTYNKRVNRLSTIQEHYMIRRAIDRGVAPEKIARALGIDVKLVNRRGTLLDGICPEVVDLLKEQRIDPTTFEVLRKLKPLRQIEAAGLMVAADNFSRNYANALMAATRDVDLVNPATAKKIKGLSSSQIVRMEREMASLTSDFKAVEENFGEDILHLVLASRYLDRLITNPRIKGFLSRHYPDMLEEFTRVIASTSMDEGSGR